MERFSFCGMPRTSNWRADLGCQGLGLGFPEVSCGEFFLRDAHFPATCWARVHPP